MTSIAPGRTDLFEALRAFILDVLPPGVDAVAGIQNRVAEPKEPNFAVMTLLRATRLRTNVDSPDDVKFTGSVAADHADFTASIAPGKTEPGEMPFGKMTVTAVSAGALRPGQVVSGTGVKAGTMIQAQTSGTAGAAGEYRVSLEQDVLSGAMDADAGILDATAMTTGSGEIQVGARVFGVDVAAGTKVVAAGTGTGGIGTYVLQPSQALLSTTLSAGGIVLEQGAQMTVQLDFHSLDLSYAGDLAQTVSTAFRDPYASTFFEAYPGIAPLHADDPRLAPFWNDQSQMETRWVLEANLQANQRIRVPAEFADALAVEIVSVDAAYPPG